MSKHIEIPAPPHEFKRLVAVRKIGESGLVQTIDATPDELKKIAAFLGIVELKRVSCEFRLTRWRARGIKLTGALEALAVQACVVTLEPVEEKISTLFERRFLPEDMIDDDEPTEEVFVDPEGEDPPESMSADIDLGEVVVEEVVLNLNPYPRKEGSAFPAGDADPAEAAQREKEKPFAALAKLKLKLQNKP